MMGMQAQQPQGAQPAQQAGQMDPKVQEAFERVVMAGLKIMYAPETREMLMDGLSRDQPIGDLAAENVAGLLRIMDDKAQGKIPRQSIIPAGVLLLQDLLKFIAETGIAQPTEDDAKQALQKLVTTLAQVFGPIMQGGQPKAQPPQGLIGQPQQAQMMGAQS